MPNPFFQISRMALIAFRKYSNILGLRNFRFIAEVTRIIANPAIIPAAAQGAQKLAPPTAHLPPPPPAQALSFHQLFYEFDIVLTETLRAPQRVFIPGPVVDEFLIEIGVEQVTALATKCQ